MSLSITPLDPWVADLLAREYPHRGYEISTDRIRSRKQIETAQAALISKLLSHAVSHSPFYKKRFERFEKAPFTELPFTLPSDLTAPESRFITVSQSEIRRIVTIGTSGTVAAKRLFFTDEDLKATEDFFLYGMSTFTLPGSVVAVFMEGPAPDSIGWTLRSALGRLGCETLVFGLIHDPRVAAAWIDEHQPAVIVGLPGQLVLVAGRTLHSPEFVLLSADMATPSIRERIEERWKCTSFNHYGLTESGWGCAVECLARQGCHVREFDILVEIIDSGGRSLPEGEWGEIVITMLRRLSFPLIRYRTGDEGRILPGPCPCGSPLKRVEILGRLPRKGAQGAPLRFYDVADSLWRMPWVEDFQASLRYGEGDVPEALNVTLAVTEPYEDTPDRTARRLRMVPGVPEEVNVLVEAGDSLPHRKPKRDWEN
ncbi:MAG TPA: phenylacetate--CoA ligase family protein [Synergistales bacterium]|nr:phenylacetate--CoA ligase family protein [Synergistales bacterium]